MLQANFDVSVRAVHDFVNASSAIEAVRDHRVIGGRPNSSRSVSVKDEFEAPPRQYQRGYHSSGRGQDLSAKVQNGVG